METVKYSCINKDKKEFTSCRRWIVPTVGQCPKHISHLKHICNYHERFLVYGDYTSLQIVQEAANTNNAFQRLKRETSSMQMKN